MKCCKIAALAVIFTPLIANCQATPTQAERPTAQTQRDISLVQRDYYAIPYGLQLSVLADAAANGDTDENKMQQQLAAAVPDITLSNITAGATVQIMDRNLSDFVTVPQPGQDILFVEVVPEAPRPGALQAWWGPITHPLPTIKTVGELLGKDTLSFPRYVALTVALQFQGRSVTYKALYLIKNDKDMPVVAGDVFLETTRYSQFQAPFVPDVLIHSKARDNPMVRGWLSSHTVPDDACNESGLCCVDDRCGIRRSEFEKEMAAPIGTSVTPTPSQPAQINVQ
jgi:hypothetical protein